MRRKFVQFKPAAPRVVIDQDEDRPIEKHVLAKAIVEMSASMKRLLASGINRKAIIVLLNDQTSLGKGTIAMVLDGLEQLAKEYT